MGKSLTSERLKWGVKEFQWGSEFACNLWKVFMRDSVKRKRIRWPYLSPYAAYVCHLKQWAPKENINKYWVSLTNRIVASLCY